MKKRGNGQRDAALLAKFKGECPPTVQKLMSGEGIKEKVGFQQLALQIGITAKFGRTPIAGG